MVGLKAGGNFYAQTTSPDNPQNILIIFPS